MRTQHQPMILGVLMALAFLLVAAVTYQGNPGIAPANGERITSRP
jgi:hypothetical protein